MVFSPLLWIKTISNIFVTDFSDFLMKFWEISKKCSNFVNFRAKKMFFFFKQVRISPEKDWFSHQWPYDDQMWYMATLLMNNHFDLCPHAGPLCTVGVSLMSLYSLREAAQDVFWTLECTSQYQVCQKMDFRLGGLAGVLMKQQRGRVVKNNGAQYYTKSIWKFMNGKEFVFLTVQKLGRCWCFIMEINI